MAFSIETKNLKGCLFGPPSPTDFRTVFKDTTVPDKVDLRERCTRVEDQGQLGSCTANASVGALEFLYKVRDGQSPDLSRLFVYFNSRRMRGTTNQDAGAQIGDAMASVLAFGACREDIWPYDIKMFAQEPSQQAYQEATMHEAIQYARVDAVDGSVSALAAGFTVVFGTRIPTRCYQDATKTGVMPIPSDEEIQNNQDGGHCMLIVGYDKPARTFIVRNSWGEGWGDRGYCYIPFEVIEKCSPKDCFWIIGELAKPANLTVIRPSRETAARPAMASSMARDVKPSGIADKAAKMREEIRKSLDAEIDASTKRIEKILGTTGDKRAAGPPTLWEPCPICLGTGRCRFCDGKGCDKCNNTGNCYRCEGKGKIQTVDSVPTGPGRGLGDWERCPLCGGSGYVDGEKCRQCNGTGYVPVYNRPAAGPAGAKTAPTAADQKTFRATSRCPSCGGSGTNVSGTAVCSVCGGTGLIGTW